MKKYIQIYQGIDPNGNNFFDDVLQVKKSLNALGYYKEPKYGITEFADESMFSAIKKFQKKNDLKIDGILKPNGETQDKLSDELKNKLGARSPTLWCINCGGPHAGTYGDVCRWCFIKGAA